MGELEIEQQSSAFQGLYMNTMQLRANIIDPNVLIGEVARAGGKTKGITGPRMLKVQNAMPGELSFLIHKTFVALLTNVVPALREYFSTPIGDNKPMLEYGVDYVMGEKKLPHHFRQPRYPIDNPKYALVFRDGHQVQMVSSDQPESMAGRSGVHAFVEEMKHNKGEKVKTRIFPGLRGSDMHVRKCPYYQGITGVSDTARVDLGEDNWFEEYEKNQDLDLIDEIATTFDKVNGHLYKLYQLEHQMNGEKNPFLQDAMRKEIEKHRRLSTSWTDTLNDQRKAATYYIRASAFVNKEFLGVKFFKTMMETLTDDEFLVALCAIRMRRVVNMFFARFDKSKHTFSDSYRYDSILKFGLADEFKLTAFYLKYFVKSESLLLGYDPGDFSSLVVAQEFKERSKITLRLQKEFTSYDPNPQASIAKAFNSFYGEDYDKRKELILYYDRAGNKQKTVQDQITSDVKLLEKELRSYGFRVRLMNEKQRTIYHYEHFKLLEMIFSDEYNHMPTVTIDENECANLISSIFLSPKKIDEHGRITLDKTSERKVSKQFQAGLTTQLSSALMYLLFGRYNNRLPSEVSRSSSAPSNMAI